MEKPLFLIHALSSKSRHSCIALNSIGYSSIVPPFAPVFYWLSHRIYILSLMCRHVKLSICTPLKMLKNKQNLFSIFNRMFKTWLSTTTLTHKRPVLFLYSPTLLFVSVSRPFSPANGDWEKGVAKQHVALGFNRCTRLYPWGRFFGSIIVKKSIWLSVSTVINWQCCQLMIKSANYSVSQSMATSQSTRSPLKQSIISQKASHHLITLFFFQRAVSSL